MKKKIGQVVSFILIFGLISINAFALQIDTVLSSTHDAYTVLFGFHISHSVSYRNITFVHGYNCSTDTYTYNDGNVITTDVHYNYTTY